MCERMCVRVCGVYSVCIYVSACVCVCMRERVLCFATNKYLYMCQSPIKGQSYVA